MAIHFHRAGSLLCNTRCFPPSLPATTPVASQILGRAKSCFSSTPFRQCSPHYKQNTPLRVQCAAGSKDTGVQSVKIAAKYDEKDLPPLLASMAIAGLPPCQESMYADEALAAILKRGPSDLFESYYHLCNSFISFVHCGTVSLDRLAPMSAVCTLVTILDDIFFDSQDGHLLEKLDIDPTILDSPERIREYLHSLDVLLRQEEPPQNPNQIQDMVWKLGCELRELSNPEWFKLYADAILDFYNANYESHCANLAGDRTNITDLESFTQIRSRTAAGELATLTVEFCNDSFLPIEIREHPIVQQLNVASQTYKAYVNDIFSYSKELFDESQHSHNLITLLMEGEGTLLPEAAWKAVNLTNSIAQDFMKLETQLPAWEEEPWSSDVHRYTEGLKELMSGHLYWHSMQKRYRHLEAPFPELRDVNVSFKPKADSVKYVSKRNC